VGAKGGDRYPGAQLCAPGYELEGLTRFKQLYANVTRLERQMDMRTLVSLSLLTVALASADTLTLKDGRVMNGTYLGGTARELRLDMGDHVETIPVERVSALQFDNSAPVPKSANLGEARMPLGAGGPAPQQDTQGPPPPRAQNPNYDRFGNNPPPPPPQEQAYSNIVIPQGTPLTVRMIDSVDSQNARMGDKFRASIEDPVDINGQTVIPRGSDVTVRLVDDKQSGKIQGRTVLTLAITNITLNGRMIDVVTGDVQQASGSRGARSAKVIGATTALGAIIGAAAGGGKGAAIGAGSGAAVGAGAEMATKGQRVKIPSETRLTFTLSSDVRL
jgi:hypothetical protein